MQKLAGSILILMAATGAGWMYGREWMRKLEQLIHFRKLMEQVKGELQYSGSPLAEIFHRIAKREPDPYGKWLMDLALRCQSARDKRFSELWKETVEKDLEELNRSGRWRSLVSEPGEILEIGDRDSVIRLLEYHLKRMDQEIGKVTSEVTEKKKLGCWIGMAGGIFLVILLI